MSVPLYKPREEYIGAGNQNVYTFDFLITNLLQIQIVSLDDLGVEVFNARGNDTSGFFTLINFNPIKGGGSITLANDLAIGHSLFLIMAHDAPTQPTDLRRKSTYDLDDIENALDFLTTSIQRNHYLLQRSMRLKESVPNGFDTTLETPIADAVPVVKPGADGFDWIPKSAFIGPQGPIGLSPVIQVDPTSIDVDYGDPAGVTIDNTDPLNPVMQFTLRAGPQGPQGQSTVLVTVSDQLPDNGIGQDGDIWIIANNGDPTNGNFYQRESGAYVLKSNIMGPPGGVVDVDGETGSLLFDDYNGNYSVTLGKVVSASTLRQAVIELYNFQYQAPVVNLTGSSSGVRERGNVLSGHTLTAAITRRSADISEVRFYIAPSTLLETQTSGGGIPSGGNSTHNPVTAISDSRTYRVEVDDDSANPKPSQTAQMTYTFVFAYYWGCDLPGRTPAQVQDLAKLIQASTATINRTFTADAGDVFYFAQPSAYPALTSIVDLGTNFETIADWNVSTGNITNSYGEMTNYRIYEFKNTQLAGTYNFSFRR